ncbi:hypothetical protein HNQ92_005159 [Rhabdobacter roseus]|uniref:Glycosyltransferase RgtA/B/C/D-like domain-containing protein n=1 Tax=Rhabdobacter roseus TaxID=1655419 RepID=A0A840TZN8_9BACT|nr:hypothetical protein [Rhabdobacter roseus]
MRILVASMVELGVDEAYYFTYAVQPDWNHFDHPPLVGIFMRLFTLNLHWVNDVSVRLPAIVGAAANTWLIALCGKMIRGDRAGLIAAILYNTSLYTGIIAGLFILPDSVQVVFWLVALYTMLKLLKNPEPAFQGRQFLWLGLFIGLAVMSKVHGVFLWLGFGGYIIFHQRNLLKNPFLYLSGILTLLIVSPIVLWNFDNQFISWQFHSARVEANNGIDLRSFLLTKLGQIAYNNPVNVLIVALGLITLFKWSNFSISSTAKVLLWCSLPIILATSLVSLLRPTLPHWSGPGFVGLTLISTAYLDFKMPSEVDFKFPSGLLRAAGVLMAIVVLTGPLLINYYPGTLGKQSGLETGSGDFTLDMYGWKALLPVFEKIRADDIRLGRMSPDAPLLTHKWFPGGHLYYYLAYPLHMRLVGVGDVYDLHKFSWLNALNGTGAQGTDAYFIVPSNYFTDPRGLYAPDFQKIEGSRRIVQKRSGRVARYWYVYRLKNARNQLGGI